MPELSTRDVVEFMVYNNIENIKSRKVIYISFSLTLIIEFLLFSQVSMIFSDVVFFDYLTNVLIFVMLYGVIAAILMHLHIMRVEKFIILNIDIFLKDVDLNLLQEAYKNSIADKIKDEQLLEYLQNYKSKKEKSQ